MKKLFYLFTLTLLISLPVSAALYVPGQYATIQAAVNAAVPGDTILVGAGTYYENVTIPQSLYIIGQGMWSTTVDAGGANKCFHVTQSNTWGKISGFTLTNSGTGFTGGTANGGMCLQTSGSGNWEISRNHFKEHPDIGILSFDNGSIHHNVFEACGGGGSYNRAIFASSSSSMDVYNNSFRSNAQAIFAHLAVNTIDIGNNLIIENATGISIANNNYTISYNDVWNNGSNYSGCGPGVGDISLDPQCIGGMPYCFYLTAGSPCIDAGNPSALPDPDGTTADIGAFFYYQGGIPISVSLTPVGIPIQIPAGGGMIEFNIEISNSGTNNIPFDVWSEVVLPSGAFYGPLIFAPGLNITAGYTADRDREQAVPLGAPSGDYTYKAYVGMYPFSIWDEDSFEFEKLTDGDGVEVHSWINRGEDFAIFQEEETLKIASIPESHLLLSAYPNPFNPSTTISYYIPTAGQVDLTIYDIRGREITKLADGYRFTGSHEVRFDGTALSSGVYFVRLTSGSSAATQKLIMVK